MAWRPARFSEASCAGVIWRSSLTRRTAKLAMIERKPNIRDYTLIKCAPVLPKIASGSESRPTMSSRGSGKTTLLARLEKRYQVGEVAGGQLLVEASGHHGDV